MKKTFTEDGKVLTAGEPLEMTIQEVRQSEEVKAQVSQQEEGGCAIQEVAQRHGNG